MTGSFTSSIISSMRRAISGFPSYEQRSAAYCNCGGS
jgi:hypothetical protein